MENLNIPPFTLPAECEDLRREVREFLAATIAALTPEQKAENWSGFDRDFSLKLGARGWIGMVWPKKYGGHERTSVERYVVLEELLAAGAPAAPGLAVAAAPAAGTAAAAPRRPSGTCATTLAGSPTRTACAPRTPDHSDGRWPAARARRPRLPPW